MTKNTEHLNRLLRFVVERHRIYVRRQLGEAPPWTRDPILAQYRFCNVYRELDRVTVWIARAWRTPGTAPHLWFALTVARLLNNPGSLADLGFPVPWSPAWFKRTLHKRQRGGLRVFNAAYIVSTNGVSMDKVDYLADRVLTPLWKQRDKAAEILSTKGVTLEQFHRWLSSQNGLGSFMSAQVVADLKYAHPQLKNAVDWHTFAASGPGSRRGMNRVLGCDAKAPWKEDEWRAQLALVQYWLNENLNKDYREFIMPPLHAQDVQNCLCEFDKYERARLGAGKPKQLFTPQT